MILNLTQHAATSDQIDAGVRDLQGPAKAALVEAMTFQDLPSTEEIRERARAISGIAREALDALQEGCEAQGEPRPARLTAMIGGAPYLMGPLERALRAAGVDPVYAFSRRETVEEQQPDGTVKKVAIFRHAGWVPAL